MNKQYLDFTNELAQYLDEKQISTNKILNQAVGTDASFYRLIPKVVIHTQNENEVKSIIDLANKYQLAVTFRAAGTSLSGQAVTDSILVIANHNWQQFTLLDNANKIRLQPGLIGEDVNKILMPFGRKIGPDPASIASCMIGGIINNNSSGMCCGIEQNSYQTISSARIIFADGTILDTSNEQSRMDFVVGHAKFITELKRIAAVVKTDAVLSKKISDKYKIKNTTGYSLNALVDYSDPFDILLHLIVGSEGTLAFLSEVVLNTVVNYEHKATTLVCFKNLFDTCKAVEQFREHVGLVAAAELMDRLSIRSIDTLEDSPEYLKTLPDETVCLLVEAQANDQQSLDKKVEKITQIIDNFSLVREYQFTQDKTNYDLYWKIRKGMFSSVGAARKAGTSFLTEDIAFPLEKLAEGTIALRKLMNKHGYTDAGIVGHALACNLHFLITIDVADKSQVEQYDVFMQEFVNMVIDDFDGSLKGEHGTGRNIAPFVEKEWGEKAYQLMHDIKNLFDPEHILNPDVILNNNPKSHISALKAMPEVSSIIDKCIECGFCESICPSKRLSLTPRQRIVMQRYTVTLSELERRKAEKLFSYYGEQTCAADGLCAVKCPVGINTGEFIKTLRQKNNSPSKKNISMLIAKNYSKAIQNVRFSLWIYGKARSLFGARFMQSAINITAKILPIIPKYNGSLPKQGSLPKLIKPDNSANTTNSVNTTNKKVVYFSSCANRMLGDESELTISEAFHKVCQRGGYQVITVTDNNLCCGMSFNSKGLIESAQYKQQQLEQHLLEMSNNGQIPIVIDASSCLYHSVQHLAKKLKFYDITRFANDFLIDNLTIKPQTGKFAFHITCSSQKNGDSDVFKNLANRLVETAIFPQSISCCGFAGDKGLYNPELNKSALSTLKSEIVDCKAGYSNNKTCEIGLAENSGIDYQSIIFLLEKSSR